MNSKIFYNGMLGRLLIIAAGLLLLAGCGGGSSSSTTTTTTTPATTNTVDITASFGPNGQAFGYYNGVFTTVTVCQPSTSNCATIPNVLVDTGSIGLRILPSALGSVTLTQISDQSDDALEECVQFGNTSYTWGPMQLADVEIGGEKAPSIAVQLIGGNNFAVPSSTCLTSPVNPYLPNNGDEDTLASLGSNGILGIGDGVWDCGTNCATVTTGSTYAGYPYYICPTGQACEEVGPPTNDQATNPVAAFSSSDNNGVLITFPQVGATGAVSLAGTMTFGIGTQSDNSLTTQTVYAADSCGYIPTITYNGLTYSDTYCSNGSGGIGGVFDTGSSGLYVLDAATLGISDCADNGFYCPSSTLTLSNIALTGFDSVGTGAVSLSIANADQLFAANPTFAVFNNLGSDSGTGPSTDYFDFGLPFFFGRTVAVGLSTTAPTGASTPNGYFAF